MTSKTNKCEQLGQHCLLSWMEPTVEYALGCWLKGFRNGVQSGNPLASLHIWWWKPTSITFTFSFWPSWRAHLHKYVDFQVAEYIIDSRSFTFPCELKNCRTWNRLTRHYFSSPKSQGTNKSYKKCAFYEGKMIESKLG